MSKNEQIFERKWLGEFVTGEKLGKCFHCKDYVHDDQLYVEEDEKISHYSCYNYKKAEEKSE